MIENVRVARGGRRVGDRHGVELLVEAGAAMGESLDLSTTMHEVARLTIPRLAELCVIDLRGDDGAITEVAVAAADEEVARGLREMRANHPIHPDSAHPVAKVLRSGDPELLAALSAEDLRDYAQGSDHERFMLQAHYRSAVVAPLAARGRTLGTLSVIRLDSDEPYGQVDLDLVAELARRAALAIDNARLYSHLRRLERRLEAILQNVAEAITLVDAHGETVFANRAAAELLGAVHPEELVRREPGTIWSRYIVLDEDGGPLSLEQMPARRILGGEQPDPLLVRNIVKETGEERWLVVRSSAVRDPDTGEVAFVVNVFENVTEIKRAERAERMLAEASRALASSLDHASTLRAVARLAVPQLVDWCVVHLVDESGEPRRVAVHHRDPGKLDIADRLTEDYPARRDRPSGVAEVLRTGHAHLVGHGDAAMPQARAIDPEHLRLINEWGTASVAVVPIALSGRAIGTITVGCAPGGRQLTAHDVPLLEELGRRAGTAVENARLYTERSRIAHTLQASLLPHSLPDIPDVELRARYVAAGELNDVGGDFYDAFAHPDGSWMLLIGDVCGKGPPAAAVTALARHTLRAAAMSGQSSVRMLETLHTALGHQPEGSDMCTVCLVRLSPEQPRRLTIALAGHPAPLLVRADGTVQEVGRHGTLLGVFDELDIQPVEIDFGPGDLCLLYTDGVAEAGSPDAPFGNDGLHRLTAEAHGDPLGTLLERIETAAVERAGGRPRDDIALLAARHR